MSEIKLKEMKLGVFGASLFTEDQLFTYTDEILLCIGGPVANFISVVFCLTLNKASSMFAMSSVMLGGLNMLPIQGFDGGRILSSMLSLRLSPKTVSVVCRLISFFLLFCLWCISVYFLIRYTATLSLFVFSVSMFSKIFMSEN